jgi:hypothetical protein
MMTLWLCKARVASSPGVSSSDITQVIFDSLLPSEVKDIPIPFTYFLSQL